MTKLTLFIIQVITSVPFIGWSCMEIPDTNKHICSMSTNSTQKAMDALKGGLHSSVIKIECDDPGKAVLISDGKNLAVWDRGCKSQKMIIGKTYKVVERKAYETIVEEALVPETNDDEYYPKRDKMHVYGLKDWGIDISTSIPCSPNYGIEVSTYSNIMTSSTTINNKYKIK